MLYAHIALPEEIHIAEVIWNSDYLLISKQRLSIFKDIIFKDQQNTLLASEIRKQELIEKNLMKTVKNEEQKTETIFFIYIDVHSVHLSCEKYFPSHIRPHSSE